MKKISTMLIILIMFNFIFAAFPVMVNAEPPAAPEVEAPVDETPGTINQGVDATGGTVDVNGTAVPIQPKPTILGAILGALISPFSYLAKVASDATRSIMDQVGYYRTNSDYSIVNDHELKASTIIFGESLLFSPDVTTTNESLNPGITQTKLGLLVDNIKKMTVAVYDLVKTLAMILMLPFLAYMLIRLVAVDNSEIKAKSKQMITATAISLLFLMILPYIIGAIFTIYNLAMDMLWEIRLQIEETGYKSFEYNTAENLDKKLLETAGIEFFSNALFYIVMQVTILKFAVRYIFIVFSVAGLVIYAPVAAVMDIKDAGNIKAAAHEKKWLKKISLTLTTQPINALCYIIFVFVAGEIASKAPLLGVVALWSLSKTTNIFKAIFK